MGASFFEKAFTPHGPVGVAASSNFITRKADGKLGFVADRISCAIGGRLESRVDRFLDKTLMLEGFVFIHCLRLRYRVENRFFAMLFDLLLETTVAPGKGRAPQGAMRFEVELKGKMFVTGAEFLLCRCGEDDIERADEILSLLGSDLIRDRILALDLADIVISYDPAQDIWAIRCRSNIGSTTWNLIPPLMQLIKPRDGECVKLMEFFELAASCVA
ncbi:MAG: hypothetical protein LBR44_08785 [Clostridiales Family XIII bacterium]|jgi:hypothetical protein|nr:hypothetical protein [Clostridiales Family XIII bacterium]